jgi:alpha-1,3-mannosyltransferase
MKVVHIVRQFFPAIGGMEEVVRSLAQQQRDQGRYEPSVITLDRVFRGDHRRLAPAETLDGTPIHRLPYAGSERYPLCPQVLGALRDADLIHVHAIDFFFDYLAWTQVVHRKPMVASTHGGFFHSPFAPRLKQVYFRCMTRLSALAYRRVIATSENDGRIFGRIVGAQRLRVIENGVNVSKFQNDAALQLRPTLIYFGRWSVNKGMLEMLDVMAALRALQPTTPWLLIIAGREYDLDAPTLRAETELRGIAPQVRIVAHPNETVLRQQISQASYFLCLSRHEGFGIAPIEGMSAGLIPLLSDIPPFRRLVEASGIGLVLKGTSPVDQAMQIITQHRHQQAQLSTYAKSRDAARLAASTYSWSDVSENYSRQYDEVLGQR